jgi:5'-nucleotidase
VRVLVTNDDGLHAPGLAALAGAMVERGHDVLAVAPEGDRSGSGAAIGNLGDGAFIRYRPMSLAGLDAVESIELDAPPALCVIAACLGAFGEPPDLVASGVNPGLNTGRATLHSGTVGAALTAANFGRRAVAVSLDAREHEAKHWDVAGRLAADVVEWLAAAEDRTVVNLSVPDRPVDDLEEVRYGTLAPFGTIRTTVLERHEDRIELGFVPTQSPLPADSDTALARLGHVVVTPLTGIRPAGASDLVGHLEVRREAG